MPDAASTATVQPPPFILDLRNRSPPTSPNHSATDAARSSSPSSLGESEDTASTNATSEASSDPLREQIIAGLIGTEKATVPGQADKDTAFAYRRSIPTMTLYSERGLSIYEEITKTKVNHLGAGGGGGRARPRVPMICQRRPSAPPACLLAKNCGTIAANPGKRCIGSNGPPLTSSAGHTGVLPLRGRERDPRKV